MKAFYCSQCSHRWFEPSDNSKKSGWGCPNGCASIGRELNTSSTNIAIDVFEMMLRKETDEKEKAKIRYHLNLLRKKEEYPF